MPLTVGRTVGPLGTSGASGSGALTDNGEGYDFAIGGLGFRMSINDERKYERATAQFRKEQYDASENTGDQSLLGYWTRGQLSFHKGAGQRYLDLGTDTELRYWSGVGANPFIKGEVSLHPAWGAATPDTYANITDCLPVGDTGLAVLADGRITYGNLAAAGTVYPAASAGRAASGMTVGGGNVYAAMSDKKIDRIGLAYNTPAIYSQGFEATSDSWYSNTGFGGYETATVARDATFASAGTASLKTVWPVTGTKDIAFVVRDFTGLTVGRAYTMVAKVWCPVGTGSKVRPFHIFRSSGVAVGTEGAWTTVSFTFTAYDTVAQVGFENTDLTGATANFWVDEVVLYDGTRVGYDTGITPAESIYSHTNPLVEVHYAKDRLFVMDSSGAWYQLAPNPSAALPVAIAAGDRVFSATTSGDWSVCDTPGPVLLANGSRIFSIKQDTTGLFPTLSTPLQVADLPIGESVVSMGYYLGFVVLVTNKGVRVAILGDQGITYGPRLTEWSVAPYNTSIARAGESVFVAADKRVIEVNLSSQIGDALEFGWAELPTPFTVAGAQGVTQSSGKIVAWGGSVLKIQQATPVASGYIETSHHRFGTLEPKKFHSVSVKVGGDGGSVSIAKVTASGSIVPLYTLPAGQGEAEITLRADAAADRLGLRFTLTADGALSPKLISYQLRALPAPVRQRMIRVPLALHDVERRGTTRAVGRPRGAWERLQALESLEAQSTIVTYQDFRTGESGQCYIEQVAHEGDTPPGRNNAGFGGVVWVTIRTL